MRFSAVITRRSRKRPQAGNAVIMILIGIALFGALAATFMRGAKTGQGNLTDQQARLAAQEIISYANAVAREIDKLRTASISEDGIDIRSSSTWAGAANPNCLDASCALFSDYGGKMTPFQLPEKYLDMTTVIAQDRLGRVHFRIGRIENIGVNGNSDLLLGYFGLKKQICEKINSLLSIQSPIPIDTAGPWYAYPSGSTFQEAPATARIGEEDSRLAGRDTFCFQDTTRNEYFFVRLLIAR